jgi:hypothetical protein
MSRAETFLIVLSSRLSMCSSASGLFSSLS